ncbi:MAG: alpha/beta fold hydrolase [Saprospiraceae bacterium]|nr:alpha/beta fold hydrolase [Saprospiraceae bacterium]
MYPKLNYRIVGQGKPVIILHGLFGMLDNWLNMAKKLESEGFMIFLIDQRDHGRSEHTEAFNYTRLANDLLHFMEQNWIHETILIGHSMGGKAGLKFVAEYGDLVSKFVVIDIGIKKYDGGHSEIFDALFDIDFNKVVSREEVEQTLMNKLNHLGTCQFLMKNLSRKKDGGFEWKMNLPLLYKEYHHILESIPFEYQCKTETLFIKGEKSNYIEETDLPIIKSALPNSRFVTIDNAGHWVHVDQPNELFKEIIAFIKG